MLPSQLTSASFSGYPPEARQLATQNVGLMQRLPLAFVPLLLRELIVYDWKFPSERAELTRQFSYLGGLAAGPFQAAMAAFAKLKLTRELEQTDWVNSPAIFSEQLSAHLWATHQIDGFRTAAVDYVRKVSESAADPALATHRLGIAVVGQGVAKNDYKLFRKLRPQGTYFTQVKSSGGVQAWLRLTPSREFRTAPFPGLARRFRPGCRKPTRRRCSIQRRFARCWRRSSPKRQG